MPESGGLEVDPKVARMINKFLSEQAKADIRLAIKRIECERNERGYRRVLQGSRRESQEKSRGNS